MSINTTKGFVMLDRELVRGDTFVALSSHATRLLIAIVDKHNGKNNGNIPYSVAEAMRWLHCWDKTATKAFQELIAADLIEMTAKASFTNKVGAAEGKATKWRLKFISR